MTTLRRFCAALGWPRLRRWSEAIERTREAERRVAAATEPEGEFHLKVMWVPAVDDSGGKHPPSKSGVGWIEGICHDPRLAIPYVWIEPKRVGSDAYETLYFVAPIADVGSRLAVVNGTALGSIRSSFIPANSSARFDALPAALKPDGLVEMPQVRVPAAWVDRISDDLGVPKRDRR